MSLISILLIATAILVVLTGLVSLVGASKIDKSRMAWFFVATLGLSAWSLSIAGFLGMPATAHETTATIFIYDIYLSALVAVPALLGYSAWKYTFGKILTILCILGGFILAACLIHDQGILYDALTMSEASGNSIHIVNGWFYYTYVIYFCTCFTIYLGILFYRAKHTKNKRVRSGDMILLIGMVISSGFTGLFDLILPFFGKYDSIWVGPLVLSIVMVIFFYSIVKYRIITVEARWMRLMAYVVVMSVGVIIYMLIFYLIFTALFKIPNPSASVLVLNFIMIVIVLLLMPVINELIASIRSMISSGQVDIAYVIKKLNKLATLNVDLRDLAAFLADHLHFSYIGFIINGKLYGSKPLAMSSDEIASVSRMKSASHDGVWQEPNKTVSKTLDELGLKAVAELRNAKGKTFGQLIVGKPLGKNSFERRDLIQLEMTINLVATVIDSEKHIRA